MIISFKHNLIFLKPRKVAGTSFEIALSKFLGETDVITPISPPDESLRQQLGFPGQQNFQYPLAQLPIKRRIKCVLRGRRPEKFFNHMSARECRDLVGESTWRDFRKVSIVRCPWDAAVSRYFWANGKNADLAEFTRYFRDNPQFLSANRAQYLIDGECCVDLFLRFEHFRDDMLELEKEIPTLSGLWDTFSGIRAKGGYRPPAVRNFTEIYGQHPGVDALIRELNAFEIDRFGYRLDL